MIEELLEVLKPVIESGMILREQQVRKESIKAAVNLLRNFGHSDKEIKYAVIEQYQLSEEEAESYMK